MAQGALDAPDAVANLLTLIQRAARRGGQLGQKPDDLDGGDELLLGRRAAAVVVQHHDPLRDVDPEPAGLGLAVFHHLA